MVEPIDDLLAHAALDSERALVAALGGGCQTPIGALASPIDGGENLELWRPSSPWTAAVRFTPALGVHDRRPPGSVHAWGPSYWPMGPTKSLPRHGLVRHLKRHD